MPAPESSTSRRRWLASASALLILTGNGSAQQVIQTPTDTAVVAVSGLLYLNYQYRLHPGGGVNRFDVDRAYLNVTGRLSERVSFRLTPDVYQVERDSVNRSWQLRAKYAYVQYDFSRGGSWPAWARLGMLQNVFIDHDELYWLRWLSPAVTDRHGFFSSADVGLSARIGLPQRSGEVYATIVNGPGFGTRELDRFKDYAARLTLTPLARFSDSPFRSLSLTAWGYKGAVASRFVSGGSGQVGAVTSSLRRDRWGVFSAVAHPRATVAVQYARRIDEGETGENTVTDPRVVTDSSGSIAAGYLIVRPFTGVGAKLRTVLSWDRVNLNRAADRTYDLLIAGLAWEFTPRFAAALDLQARYPGSQSVTPPVRTLFLHTQTRF